MGDCGEAGFVVEEYWSKPVGIKWNTEEQGDYSFFYDCEVFSICVFEKDK